MKIKIPTILYFLPLSYIFMVPCWPIVSKKVVFFVGALNFLAYAMYVLKKNAIRKPNLFELGYIAFIILCIIQSRYSPSPYTSSLCERMTVYYICAFSSVRLLAVYDKMSLKHVQNVLDAFVAGTVTITIFCLLKEGFSFGRLGEETYALVGGDRIELSVCLMFSLLYCIWSLFFGVTTKKKSANSINIGVLLFLMLGTALSNTRKVFVAAILMFIFCMFVKSRKSIVKLFKYIVYTAVVVLIAWIIIQNNDFLREMIVEKVVDRFMQLFAFMESGAFTADYSASARALMREKAMGVWREHMLLGVGTDGFRMYNSLGENISGLYSHCNFTELLANNGLLGFGVYYIPLINMIYKAWTARKIRPDLSTLIVGALTILMLMDYGQVSYYYWYYITFYMIISDLTYTTMYRASKEDLISGEAKIV